MESQLQFYDQIISENYQLLDFNKLISLIKTCVLKQCLLPEEIKNGVNTSDANRVKQIMVECLKRDAIYKSHHFVECLLHNGYDRVAQQLDGNYVSDLIDLSRCDPESSGGDVPKRYSFGHTVDADKCKLIKTKEKEATLSGIYPLTKEPRGYCVLINNYFTIGTYKEMQRFRHIFFQLHFRVIMEKNLSAADIKSKLSELSKSDDLRQHEAIMVMIITHGNDNKEILGFDDEPIKIDSITNIFNNKNCPQLQNKPRMFFFNCCRGSTNHPSVSGSLASSTTGVSLESILPETDDTFVCYSTLDGYLAQVNWDNGTNFGAAVAESFINKAWHKELNAILTRANCSLVKSKEYVRIKDKLVIKQPIEWVQSTTKETYFNPSYPFERIIIFMIIRK